MKNTLLILSAVICLSIIGCAKAKTQCYKCIDLAQVDPVRDVCSDDTTAAGRNAFTQVSTMGYINSTNGTRDSCQGFTK